MSARVYVLQDVEQEELAEVVRTLRGRPDVAMVDAVEGPPDIIMMVEARGRRRLAELTIEAISSIENMTMKSQLLPVIDVRRNQTNTFLPVRNSKLKIFAPTFWLRLARLGI